MDNGFLPKAGGFRKLKAYVLAEAIFDLTAVFVRRFVPSKSRTCDQMEQAARSGKQNIAEGSMASATSKETEIKLTNVAKASLEELKVDYDDYLRRNNLPLWEADYERQVKLKEYLRSEDFLNNPLRYAETMDAEMFCNMCITLICQDQALLGKLILAQQKQFEENGGIRELMSRVRREKFKK